MQKALRDLRVAIDAGGIDRTDPAAGDGGDGEAPILAARRKQLHRVAHFDPERLGQPRTNNHRTWIVAKIIKLPGDDLPADVGRAQMKRRIDPEEIDRRGLKLGPRA